MHADQFDTVLRTLTITRSRRGVLAGLGGLLTVMPLAYGGEEVAAKNKKKKHHGHHTPSPQPVPPAPSPSPSPTCTPNCAGRVCGDDGCGGICGSACGNGQECEAGICVCPRGQVRLGNGSCATPCGDDADCGGNCQCNETASFEGQRVCGPLASTCAELPQVCAGTTACPVGEVCQEVFCPIGQVSYRCFPLCTG